MFFLVSGVMASGKSTVARLLPGYLENVECHDADELVAEDSDTRCIRLEHWVQQALEAQQVGRDFLLADHAPLGELLACPSAPDLNGIAACLLNCTDAVRAARYTARGIDPRWPIEPQLHWAAWHRRHARDPRWMPHVVTGNGPPSHQYDRWRTWTADDPRWRVFVLDTSELSIDQTLTILQEWVQVARTTPTMLSQATRWWEPTGAHSAAELPPPGTRG
jgi:hypothetical protein